MGEVQGGTLGGDGVGGGGQSSGSQAVWGVRDGVPNDTASGPAKPCEMHPPQVYGRIPPNIRPHRPGGHLPSPTPPPSPSLCPARHARHHRDLACITLATARASAGPTTGAHRRCSRPQSANGMGTSAAPGLAERRNLTAALPWASGGSCALGRQQRAVHYVRGGGGCAIKAGVQGGGGVVP